LHELCNISDNLKQKLYQVSKQTGLTIKLCGPRVLTGLFLVLAQSEKNP